MIDILERKIVEQKPFAAKADMEKRANMYKGYYTGEGNHIKEELWKYRKLESVAQKEQRHRITVMRPKHVCSQIENILDQLQTLDTPAINIDTGDRDNIRLELEKLVYELNLEQQAFNTVKYYNIVDPNSFLVASMDEFGLPKFDVIECHEVFDFQIRNERVFYLIAKFPDNKYRIYTPEMVIDYQMPPGKPLMKTGEYNVGSCYAYQLGWSYDSRQKFTTFKSILDPASEMLKQLLWDGSEYDVIKLAHGIVKQFAYAPKCTYQRQSERGYEMCEGGNYYINNELQQEYCPACKGSGMRIHTSSQDIIFLPEPTDLENTLPLEKLTHTVFIPDSILESRKRDIQETEDKIIRTVFNSNQITREEIAKTATEISMDMKGVYSMLTKFGKKVSETFIWMIEVICDMRTIQDVSVFHGYTMDLNLDSLDNMFTQRERAVKSGIGMDVINQIDRAIIKKQNMDNPMYLDRVETWETFKPFADKTIQERQVIVMNLPENNRERILYLYWYKIKNDIIFANPDFYDLERERQRELIDEQISNYIENPVEFQPEFSDI